jgi:hypothetical protein
MNRLVSLVFLVTLVWLCGRATATVTSAQISKQLDTIQNLDFDTTLPDAMQQIGKQTGVRIEADPAIWDLLPWGEQTNITAKIRNHTLRDALSAITQKLGLEFALTDEAVELRPMPALRRLGKRATVDEMSVLDMMSRTPINLKSPRLSVHELLAAVDERLIELKSPFAVDDRSADGATEQKISIPRNASIAEALEAMTQQANAAWYPWGKSILVVPKQQQIRTQLAKTLTAHYDNVDVAQVLLELSQRAGVDFLIDPGAYQRIAPQYRKVQLLMDNASVQQALDSIGGYTGLGFEVTEKGVRVWNQYLPAGALPPPTTHPIGK